MKNALFIHPPFPDNGFWNYKSVCSLMGAKYPAAPLGLITVASLLPKEWNVRLVDMNASDLDDSLIDQADIVFTGGMLPQQKFILGLIDRIHARGKRVVLGGPEPTSQPGLYGHADYLLTGEAEASLPRLIDDLGRGVTSGTYSCEEKPDLTLCPVPRFDLLDFRNYLMVGVQYGRGCPFNCEFCDVIELFGRQPRTKTVDQLLRELDELYRLGYRGHIDFVDDNFIANKKKAKEVLTALRDWQKQMKHPFFFSTEASINLADDEELLGLMSDVDFRYIFVGIESADKNALQSAKKFQNVNRRLHDDLAKIYDRGIIVNGGFIVGFDSETRETARMLADTVEAGNIPMAMVGLLYALPNTQLTRRLEREQRLFHDPASSQVVHEVDQTTAGINFRSLRPREEIMEDYIHILDSIYDDKRYFDRVLRLGKMLRTRYRQNAGLSARLRMIRAFLRCIGAFGMSSKRALYFWRNILALLFTRPSSLEAVVNLMAMHLHFKPQKEHVKAVVKRRMNDVEDRIVPEPLAAGAE